MKVASQALTQVCECISASEVTLTDMGTNGQDSTTASLKVITPISDKLVYHCISGDDRISG